MLLNLVDPKGVETLLDVGGGPGISDEFALLYRKFHNVTVANLNPSNLRGRLNAKVRLIKADGCALPFGDNSFNWVFSNAVIEHVGGWARQQAFAAEVRRVAATGYFVATPNKYFPIEPHALLPLYQFYPATLQTWALRVSPGYMKVVEDINLLSPRKLHELFPEATVYHACLCSSLVAVYRKNCPASRTDV